MAVRAGLLVATVGVAALLAGGGAQAQPLAPSPAPTIQTSPAQLDDLLAPVALYPDDLLSDVLMAASYPVEVAQADRWLQEPANLGLTGDALFRAVDQQDWDPSVKSLTAFPRVLRMMDSHLEWTESLGEAFIANPEAVTAAVQDLRHRAMAAGALHTTPEVVVNVDGPDITIAPAAPQTVDYPAYNPATAYGPWPYPDFPPYAFDDIYGGCVVGEFGYCWFDVAIIAPFWGWNHWDWRHHHIAIDPGRFADLNHHRPPAGGSVWTHERGHRHGVPYLNPETRARYPAAQAQNADRAARGFDDGATVMTVPHAAAPRPNPPPAFESYGAGARAEGRRGQSSRMSAPSFQPRGGTPSMGGRPRP